MPGNPVKYDRFDPEYAAARYSPRDAYALCLACHLAYAKLPSGRIAATKIRQRANTWGFPAVESFEIRRGKDIDTQGFVAADARRVLAVFRGSDSGADWRANLQTVRDPGPFSNTRVHEGFQDAFHAATLEVGRTIGNLRDANQEVWVAGHSLGGAMAVLLVASLLEVGVPVRGLYTYGAPRVGNKRFEKEFNRRHTGASWRVVNAGDVVPHVPLEPFFSHTGQRMLFLENGDRTDKKGAWTKFRANIWGWLGGKLGDRRIVVKDAHVLDSPTGYLAKLLGDLDGPAG